MMLICIIDEADRPIDKDGNKAIGCLLVAIKNNPIKKTMPSSAKVSAYRIMTDVIYPYAFTFCMFFPLMPMTNVNAAMSIAIVVPAYEDIAAPSASLCSVNEIAEVRLRKMQ